MKKLYLSILLFTIFINVFTNNIYASSNNFLNVNIKESNDCLIITEDWNIILKEDNVFEREIPIDNNSIRDLTIKQTFPKTNFLISSENYNESDNTTKITTNLDLIAGNSALLTLEYKLTLDEKTKENFINCLPYSLTNTNTYEVNNIGLSVSTKNIDYNDKVEFTANDTFEQTSSKSRTLEVIAQLIKLLFNIIIICAICFIGYVLALIVYYKSKSKINKKYEFKKIKSKKNKRISKKELLKTRMF